MAGKARIENALFEYWKLGLVIGSACIVLMFLDELSMRIPAPILIGAVAFALLLGLRWLSVHQARLQRNARAENTERE